MTLGFFNAVEDWILAFRFTDGFKIVSLPVEQIIRGMHALGIVDSGYDWRYSDYVCVNETGTLISPNYISGAFPKLLEKNGLRKIRFHDLRHSCASLLLANNVPMKQIQEWLGHSDFSTTANIYAHLDYSSKVASADAMLNGLKDALSVWA